MSDRTKVIIAVAIGLITALFARYYLYPSAAQDLKCAYTTLKEI